jgi:heat shock protein HslJ
MKTTLLCASIAALALCGCGAYAARDPAPAAASNMNATLDGTHWKFVEVGGTGVPAGVTATLRLKGGQASGKAGCNAYGASYQISADGAAHFQRTLSTKMACLQPAGAMQVERGVFAALREAVKVEIDHSQLVLLNAANKPVAKLMRAGAL